MPNWLLSYVKITTILFYLRGEGILTDDIKESCFNSMKISNQWNQLLYIENLPFEWSVS